MSKVISAYDLVLADELSHFNQFDLVNPENMDAVNSVLAKLGFNTDKAIHIYAANHRTLQNKVRVGYLFSGEYNLSREHIKGPYSTLEDVMIAASFEDESLASELHSMGHTCPSYGSPSALDQQIPEREDAEYKAEEERITAEIKQLEDILFHIRGSQYRRDGSVKTAWDYKNPEQVVVKKKRRKKVKQEEGNVNG